MPSVLNELCHIHNSSTYLKMERSFDINTIISSSTLRFSGTLETKNPEPNTASVFKQQLIRRCSQPVLRLVHRASSIFENAENRRPKSSTTQTSSPVESIHNSLPQSSGNELQSASRPHTSGSGRRSSVRRSYSSLARSQVLIQRQVCPGDRLMEEQSIESIRRVWRPRSSSLSEPRDYRFLGRHESVYFGRLPCIFTRPRSRSLTLTSSPDRLFISWNDPLTKYNVGKRI